MAQESDASSWLTTLPIEEFGFALHKGAFRDALALLYGWCPAKVHSHCACGQPFSVSHALPCHMGGYPSIRHNEMQDLTADIMSSVSTEPYLQPVDGEILSGASANTSDGGRLDIAANGLWGEGGRFERAFFDVRVFNPYAPTNRRLQPATCYRHHKNAMWPSLGIDIIHGTGLETYHVSVSCAISHARPIRVTVFAPPSSCISIETLFFNLHYFVGLYRRTW